MTSVFPLPCVLFALERERIFFHETYRIDETIDVCPCPTFLCSNGPTRVLVIESGVGAERTRRALDWLLNRPTLEGGVLEPSILLFAGFAGALQPAVHVGDVLLAREVLDTTGRVWPASALVKAVPGAQAGRLLTASRFIGDPAEKLALGAKHDALAVDMESAGELDVADDAAARCRTYKVEFLLPPYTKVANTASWPEGCRVRPSKKTA